MSLLGWILFGLVTGFVASRVVNQRGEGCILNIALGILGACVGGFIFNALAAPESPASTFIRCLSP